jgi:hypothetical protein
MSTDHFSLLLLNTAMQPKEELLLYGFFWISVVNYSALSVPNEDYYRNAPSA